MSLQGSRIKVSGSGSLGGALVACTGAGDDRTGVMEAYPEAVRALHGEIS
jgi:hypothetical protein